MQKKLTWLVIVFVVFFGGRWLIARQSASSSANAAQERVTAWLDNMKSESGEDVAASQWANGTSDPGDRADLNRAKSHLKIWCQQQGISQPISDYSIESADGSVTPPTVTAKIDGTDYVFAIIEKKTITIAK